MAAYIATVLALLAALAGALGETHRLNASGWRRIRPLGWGVITIAFASAAVGAWQIYAQDAESRELAARRVTLGALARTELCIAAIRLKGALDIQYDAATGKSSPDGRPMGYPLTDLRAEPALTSLKKLDFADSATFSAGRRFPKPELSVPRLANDFVSRANTTLAKFGEFLDPDLVVLASQLVNANYVQWLIEVPSNIEFGKARAGVAVAAIPDNEESSYLETLDALAALGDATGADLEGPMCLSNR